LSHSFLLQASHLEPQFTQQLDHSTIIPKMASTETCQLNETHPPKERSIEVFSAVLPEIKSQLLSLRHLHPPAYFDAVKDLSNHDLTSFTVDNLKSVRVGTTAVKFPHPAGTNGPYLLTKFLQYGMHIFGKIQLPKSNDGYIHVRVFVGGGEADKCKVHCIHIEAKENEDGGKEFRAIMKEEDELKWFNE